MHASRAHYIICAQSAMLNNAETRFRTVCILMPNCSYSGQRPRIRFPHDSFLPLNIIIVSHVHYIPRMHKCTRAYVHVEAGRNGLAILATYETRNCKYFSICNKHFDMKYKFVNRTETSSLSNWIKHRWDN